MIILTLCLIKGDFKLDINDYLKEYNYEEYRAKDEEFMKNPDYKLWCDLCFMSAWMRIPLEELSARSEVPLDKIRLMFKEIIDHESLKKIATAIENYITDENAFKNHRTAEYTLKMFKNMKQDWQKGD